MHNRLTEQVLDTDMLYLMTDSQNILQPEEKINMIIGLLEATSKFISAYRRSQPISLVQNETVTDLVIILVYFTNWEEFWKKIRHMLAQWFPFKQ